ncbi:hypothetical protein SEA_SCOOBYDOOBYDOO_218 [Mycobacterium phage ScoobyDoobyDoo]|nr:hypothetical protein SEA_SCOOBYDOOBYDOO_218 [Mycobacterium phage ScoobyDoobyDoo]
MAVIDPDAPIPYSVAEEDDRTFDVIVACEYAVRVSGVSDKDAAISFALSGDTWKSGDQLSGPTLMDVREVPNG